MDYMQRRNEVLKKLENVTDEKEQCRLYLAWLEDSHARMDAMRLVVQPRYDVQSAISKCMWGATVYAVDKAEQDEVTSLANEVNAVLHSIGSQFTEEQVPIKTEFSASEVVEIVESELDKKTLELGMPAFAAMLAELPPKFGLERLRDHLNEKQRCVRVVTDVLETELAKVLQGLEINARDIDEAKRECLKD